MAGPTRQLLLDVIPATGLHWLPTGGTQAAVAALEGAGTTCICLYGPTGSGKSTLLKLAAQKHPGLYVADNLESATPQTQEELFHTFNSRGGKGLLVASAVPVAQLALLPDLKSRLLTGTQIEVELPNDEELHQLLMLWAQARQIVLPQAVADYVLLRAERNPAVLAALVTQLDALSLAQKRAVTVPLARQILGGA